MGEIERERGREGKKRRGGEREGGRKKGKRDTITTYLLCTAAGASGRRGGSGSSLHGERERRGEREGEREKERERKRVGVDFSSFYPFLVPLPSATTTKDRSERFENSKTDLGSVSAATRAASGPAAGTTVNGKSLAPARSVASGGVATRL